MQFLDENHRGVYSKSQVEKNPYEGDLRGSSLFLSLLSTPSPGQMHSRQKGITFPIKDDLHETSLPGFAYNFKKI